MNKLYAIVAVLILLMAAGLYQQLFSTSAARREATDVMLQALSGAVASKDRVAIGATLEKIIAEDARLRLDVSFFSLAQPDARPVVQDFDRAGFITFIDNLLYSLTDYGLSVNLKQFELSGDTKAASATTMSNQWGEGNSYYGGVPVDVRFNSNGECTWQLAFNDAGQARITQFACAVHVRMAPKPGQENKIQSNPQAIMDMLK